MYEVLEHWKQYKQEKDKVNPNQLTNIVVGKNAYGKNKNSYAN